MASFLILFMPFKLKLFFILFSFIYFRLQNYSDKIRGFLFSIAIA